MPLEIIRNDITKVRADAIVNTANPNVAVGRGVDTAIYNAAGREQLLAERAKIGPLDPGECAVTPAFGLQAKYIIHTVGPAWEGGDRGEVETVARCYRGSLEKARELECESVAFPLISAGTYGFPKDVALKTAIAEITGFLFANEMTVYLVVYDKEAFEVSGKAFSEIRSFIDEKDVIRPQYDPSTGRRLDFDERIYRCVDGAAPSAGWKPDSSELTYNSAPAASRPAQKLEGAPKKRKVGIFGSILPDRTERPRRERKDTLGIIAEEEPKIAEKPGNLDDLLKTRDDTFQEYLFRIIDRKGLEDPEVYKKANIDRKHFSKIRSNKYYNPSKKTALALAVALELNLDETRDLLLKAGLALNHSSTFDLIMEYCINNRITDIYEINCILFKYDQPTLGA